MAEPGTRADGTARGVLFVHSSPRAVSPHVEWAVGKVLDRGVSFEWVDQPVLPGALRTEFVWEGVPGDGARLASALCGWEHVRFEVSEDPTPHHDGARWMHTPDLGVFYGQTDVAGNLVIAEDRVRYAMELASADPRELQHELRIALGQSWDDELEVFRHAGDLAPVVWMHRVG